MPDLRTLKAIYNLPKSGNFRSTLNAIIRRHWPGGSEVLDVMERLHQMQTGRDRPDPALQDMLDKMRAARDAITKAILSEDGLEKKDALAENVLIHASTVATPPPCTKRAPLSIPPDLLGTKPDSALAKEYGVSSPTVRNMRLKLGIQAYRGDKPRIDWARWDSQILETSMTSQGLASLIGCDESTIRERRRFLRGSSRSKYNPAAAASFD